MHKRRGHWQGELLAKGNDTRRALVKSFQQGRDNGLMFDQHYTQGKPTLFFGKACQSASGPVELALKYDYEMILVQGWRVDRGWWRRPNFTIRFESRETRTRNKRIFLWSEGNEETPRGVPFFLKRDLKKNQTLKNSESTISTVITSNKYSNASF